MSFSAEEEVQYRQWCCGDETAVDMLRIIGEASRIADDFVDGDTQSPDDMAALLHLLLVALPSNQFYRQHQMWLLPVMVAGLQQWNASNDWAVSSDENVQMFGYVYREAMEQIISVVAMLCGGDAHGRQVAKEVNDFYHQRHGETFKEWVQNG